MDRNVSVKTPESIAFSYELAGLGSRFLAVAIDFLIQALIMIAIVAGFAWAGSTPAGRHASGGTEDVSTNVVIAFVSAIVFIVFFGYFIVFEAFWNGQTPGKKLLGIRVVRDGGYPLDFSAALNRNLIRVAEEIVGFYAISVATMLISAENKRLGDLAAGTIVVRDARAASLKQIVKHADSPLRARLLTDREQLLVDRFVARKAQLNRDTRVFMAARLAAMVRPRLPAELKGLRDEELLERLSAS